MSNSPKSYDITAKGNTLTYEASAKKNRNIKIYFLKLKRK